MSLVPAALSATVEIGKRELSLTVGRRELATLLGRSVASIDRDLAAGALPVPLRLGATGRTVKWLRSEITAWLEAGAPPRDEWDSIKAASRRGAR